MRSQYSGHHLFRFSAQNYYPFKMGLIESQKNPYYGGINYFCSIENAKRQKLLRLG